MKKKTLFADIFLAAVIVALYVFTSGSNAQETMAEIYASPVYRGKTDDAVAFEIVVSWDAAAVEDMLDVLRAKGVAATFAVTEEYARERPELIRRMSEEGHEIAAAGNQSLANEAYSSIKRDVAGAIEAVEAACGVRPELYYAGETEISKSSRAASALSLKLVACTVDLRCASGMADDIILRGLNEPLAGSIILLQPTSEASEALPGLIDGLQAKGLRVVRISDVLARSAGNE